MKNPDAVLRELGQLYDFNKEITRFRIRKTAKPKRGRGRPKGSKNRKTLEKLNAAITPEVKGKRGPGRPKGSRNKPRVRLL